MKNLLITGGCGFIGSNLIRYLLDDRDFEGRIINVDLLTYAGNPENLDGISAAHPGRYIFEQADVADREAMASIFERFQVDTVCHLAAESHVDRSISDPSAFIRTNIQGTFTLLELCRELSGRIERFHHVSTDEVYGSLGASGTFSETSPYQPNSPYAASKASSDHLVRAYHHTYGLPVTISNCSNNYGPYQFPEKLIPLMILNALEGKQLPVYGDGQQVRDWLHVQDHCAALWRIMQAGVCGRVYNVGGNCERTNLEVVRTITELLDNLAPNPLIGMRSTLIRQVADRPGHDRRYAVDCSRVTRELGWEPLHDFSSGLYQTVTWYLEHHDWAARVRDGSYRNWIRLQYGSPHAVRSAESVLEAV